MAKIAIFNSKGNSLAPSLFDALRRMDTSNEYHLSDAAEIFRPGSGREWEARCIYAPSFADRDGLIPDLSEAAHVFQESAHLSKGSLLLVSSALIYGIGPSRQGMVTEEYSAPRNGGRRICDQWIALEDLAFWRLGHRNMQVIVLRPAIVLPSPTWFSRLFSQRFIPTLPGYDPTLQILSLSDLAEAVRRAMDFGKSGIFNVAPDGVVPLRKVIRAAGSKSFPIPRTLQRLSGRSEALDYVRYPWTMSNDKMKSEMGFAPCKSSLAALAEWRGQNPSNAKPDPEFDTFGMDKDYIRFYGKTLFKFLCNYYWRIETRGLEHVPRQGRGVLVGMHRGFMPFDGVMALHLMVQKTGRFPRFLTHPSLLKFPFLANFMNKLGAVPACRENADSVLAADELLGIFPEGIQGTFTPYRNAYKLQSFGRNDFVKIALRNRAPLLPFVTVGSAEIFPIFGRIRSRFWTRYSQWPCFPLTPTFPILPLPLPSKWHTWFLPPIPIERQYPPEAAGDGSVVKTISLQVRAKMQEAVDEMLSRRRSIFFGSIFGSEKG